GEAGQLRGSVLQGKQAEQGVLRGAARSIPQVVGDRVSAEKQNARLQLRQSPDEGSVTGAEVDVDRLESAGQIEQSSTVYAALLPAFDEDHEVSVPRGDLAGTAGLRIRMVSRVLGRGGRALTAREHHLP